MIDALDDPTVDDVVLNGVTLERKFLGTVSAKSVDQGVGYAARVIDDRVFVGVAVEISFVDTDDDEAALLKTSYSVQMTLPKTPGAVLDSEQEARILRIATDIAWPFLRELVVDFTTRMRIPPYFLDIRPIESPTAAEAHAFFDYLAASETSAGDEDNADTD